MIDADSRLDGSQTQVQIVCKPVPARHADAGSNSAAPQESSGRKGFRFYAALLATTMVCFNLFFFVLGYLVAVADDRHVRHIGATILACCNGAFVSGFLAAFWRVT